jgi:outer membrane immunogenic protein
MRAIVFACITGLLTFSITTPSNAQGPDRPFSWTGFYVGFHGTYLGADQEYPGANPHPAGPPRQELSGALLGGQVGYNFQVGRAVLGVEADYSKGNLSSTARDGNSITQTVDIEWTGSLRGRVGLPFNNLMPYVTAGYMWMGANFNQTCPDPASQPFGHCNVANGFAPYNLTDTRTHGGWVYGIGLEWMVARNFSVRAEGLWYSMGDETYRLGTTPSGKTVNPASIEYDGSMFRVGGNYRF